MGGILDPLYQFNLRAFAPIQPPTLNPPAVDGNAGSVTASYCATFVTLDGETPPGNAVAISNAPNTLTGFDRVKITVAQVPAAATLIRFFKHTGSVFGLLGTAVPGAPSLWDQGQVIQSGVNPPVADTSGRTNWLALLPRTAKRLQRAEVSDLQGMLFKAIGDIVSSLHSDGDVISGCVEQSQGSNVWNFTAGQVVMSPFHLQIPAGQVTLTGTGDEKVGLLITPAIIDDNADPIIRDVDEGIDLAYALPGCYRLGATIEWVVDQPGMIVIREFLNGQPKIAQYQLQMSQTDITDARRRYDVSGSFVVRNFPMQVLDDTDPTKFDIKVLAGKGYPDGFEIETVAPQTVVQPRARNTATNNNAVTDPFESPGGAVLGTVAGPFNVDGKSLKIGVGSGGAHTVTLSGSSETAAQVATQIMNALNAYPTSPGTLVACLADSTGHLQIQAVAGQALILYSVATDAYSVLGLTMGTYLPGGRRIYQADKSFLQAVSDMNYPVKIVEEVTHNGLTHIDPLANTNVRQLLGASATASDANDGKWNYQYGVDFGKTGDSIDFSLYGGSKPASGASYYVAYIYNYTATKGSRTLVQVTDAQVVKGALGSQDTLVVTGGTYKKVIDGSPVTGLTGSVSDAHQILQVNLTSGQGQSQFSSYALLKNSDALSNKTSQIDWSSAGSVTASQPTTGSTYYITFTFWQHAVEGDYVSADSYDVYGEIEYAPNGTWNLRDCIDFRTAGKMPVPEENAVFDFTYYLARMDKIVLKSDGTFYAITGTPSEVPLEPSDPATGLVLAKVIINPYTYSAKDVTIVSIQALRRTQISIQELAEEIQKLQYYQALNTTESAASDAASSANIDAKGIFTDALTGTGRCDFAFNKNGVQFTAAIDQTNQQALLPVSQDARELAIDLANSQNIQQVGSTICFQFEETAYQSQLQSTSCNAANPNAVYSWLGVLVINPPQDAFTDINQLPQVDVNYDDNMAALTQIDAENAAAANSIVWGSWNLASDYVSPPGISDQYTAYLQAPAGASTVGWSSSLQAGAIPLPSDVSMFDESGGYITAVRTRQGTQTTIVPQRTLVDLGNVVIDRTVVPMCRTTLQDGSPFYVACNATSMKPGVPFFCTINGVMVDLIATGSYAQGPLYQGSKTVVSDASGNLTGQFVMPSGIPTGTAEVKISWTDQPTESNAAATFTSQGYLVTQQDEVQGQISTTTRTTAVSETNYAYVDPLAQTFLVTQSDGTVYISSVDLFVCSKDPVIPLTVEIRKTLNGYPTQDVIQTKTLNPSDIHADPTSQTATRFTFGNVVGYSAAEYAIAIIANSDLYWVSVADLGGTSAEDGQVIMAQAQGVFFESPNNSTWVPVLTRQLKYQINRSNFQNNAQIVFDDITGIEAGLLCAKVTQFLPTGTDLRWSYSIDERTTWIPFAPLVDTSLGSIATTISLLVDVTTVGNQTFLIVDNVAGIMFLLHNSTADYIGTNAPLSDPSDTVTVYLDLDVDGVNGSGARSITPFYSDDDGVHWVQLKPPTGYTPVAVGNGQLQEYQFITPGEASVSTASNTSPVVITSPGHGFQEDQLVLLAGVGGNTNANGTWRAKNVTTDTFELHDPNTGAAIAGNGAYTSGGTIRVAPISQCRIRINFQTSNRALSPIASNIRVICGNTTA